MNKQRGFTLFELIFAILWLGCLSLGVTLGVMLIRALMKYAGA